MEPAGALSIVRLFWERWPLFSQALSASGGSQNGGAALWGYCH